MVPFSESPEFQRLLRKESRTDLFKIALEIARDAYPELDAGHYLGVVDALADRARDRCALLETAAGSRPDQLGPVRRGAV